MGKEINFAIFTIRKNLESASDLKFSFIMSVFGMFLNNISFVIIWYIFGTIAFGLGGWKPIDAFGLMGYSAIGYGFCFAFFGGIRNLPEMVQTGDFDKFLLSPKNILLRLSTSVLSVPAVGDIVFGIVFITIWLFYTKINLMVVLLSIVFIILSTIFHFTFALFANSFAFYFGDSRSLTQGVFELFMGPSLFQGGAIQGSVRIFFVFIVPALLTGVYPVEIIRDGSLIQLFEILSVGLFWSVFSIWFFYRSVKKYESANFVNFG